ncbi:MAG: 4-(cytidine 5'-diphospho)-2-C-methyl-D-erythritol kinase [Candidatus Tumulicola sp.]
MAPAFLAPAKINLTLEVLARRDDGYHGIRSVMVPLDLADELVIERSERFVFACDRADLEGNDNLVVRALAALGELPPCRIELRKRIPTQAGLGGGSSDAAAILRAAMAGAFGPRPAVDWLRIARGLGSDVPFFLAGTGALVEGTGERVTPLGALPPWHALVIKPPVDISTAAAYADLDRQPRDSRPRSASHSIAMLTALQRGRFDEVEALLQNDFQRVVAARAPEIGAAIDALESAGAPKALLAGSGSCVFTLADSRATIERRLERLSLPDSYRRFAAAFAATPDWRA